MNENFAIGSGSSYPERRGVVMPQETPRSKRSDDETLKVNGEIRPSKKAAKRGRDYKRTTKAELKAKQAEERERKQTEREKRTRELQKELQEARESSRKTQKSAEEVIGTSKPQTLKDEPRGTEEPPEGTVTVVTNNPLQTLSREELVDVLGKNGVDIKVPDDWDDFGKWGFLQRASWIDDHKLMPLTTSREEVVNVAQEEYDLDSGFIFRTKVGKNEFSLYRHRDGDRYVVGGMADDDISSENIKKIFDDANVGIKLPKGFDNLSPDEKVKELERIGVAVVAESYNLLGSAVLDAAALGLLVPGVRGIAREIIRENSRPAAIGGPRLAKFEYLEQKIEDAIEGERIDPDDPAIRVSLETVRSLLADSIRALRIEEVEARRAEIEREQGLLDFNEYFGDDFIQTREYIRTGNTAELRRIMEELKGKADLIILWQELVPTFDVANQATWPPVEIINPQEVRKLYEVTRALDGEAGKIDGRQRILDILSGGIVPPPPADVELLEQFITANRNNRMWNQVSRFYNNIYTNLDERGQASIAGDIVENAGPATTSITSGWREFNQRMKMLFDVVKQIRPGLNTAEAALREWRGMFAIDGVERGVNLAKLNQPPDNWEDTPEAIYKLITSVEPSGLSPQDLGPILNIAYDMLRRIETDTPFGSGMHFELRGLLEAFKVKQSIAITMHLESQDPKVLQRVYKEINGDLEEFFTKMISRFARDAKGRRWYVIDAAGNAEAVNLVNPAKTLYSERLRADRIKMNMVEEMTKYSILNPFNAATIAEIRHNVGFDNLPDEWQDPPIGTSRWLVELEAARQWLSARMQRYIAAGFQTPLDPEHPLIRRPATLGDWGTEPDLRHGITKSVIKDWYERKTLHGAYGEIDSVGLDEIAGYWDHTTVPPTFVPGELTDIFRAPGESDEEVGRRIREMCDVVEGYTWQQLRRTEMRQRIRNELEAMGLHYDPNVKFGERGVPTNLKTLSREELDRLLTSGYIGSLDATVYDITWLFEYSTYNMIHIYGQAESKYEDDYKALVSNRSSDLYFGTMIDHSWEFVHPDYEGRGRGKQDDVNDAFKQPFMGKHKWFFAHISSAVRFIEPFLNDHDRDLIRERTRQLVDRYDFHNNRYELNFEDFARGIAVRELIIEGAISFADRNFSEVVAERDSLNKFNPIDNAADRGLVEDFMQVGTIQAYLSNPEAKSFDKMVTKGEGALTTRDERLFAWVERALKGHLNVVHDLKFTFFGEANITVTEFENFVHNQIAAGTVEAGQGERFIRRNLGLGPGILGAAFFRNLRGLIEEEGKESHVTRKPLWLRILILFFWTLPFESLKSLGKGAGEEIKKQQI